MDAGPECVIEGANAICRKEQDALKVLQRAEEGWGSKPSESCEEVWL